MPDSELTPQERIALAEAEEVEAMRDILKAEARSAAAEAQMMEDLVALNKANVNTLMGFTQQGPLETNSLPAVIKTLIAEVGLDAAKDILKEGYEYIKDLVTGTSERQKGRAEQTKANAIKEGVIKGTSADGASETSSTSDLSGGDVGIVQAS